MAAPKPDPRFVLLVEGRDDREFIFQLSNFAGIVRGAFQVQARDGFDALVDSIKGILRASDLECLGIIVDADLDVDQQWNAVTEELRRLGFASLPRMPEPGGLIHQEVGQSITVGLWLMPDNRAPGMLEDMAVLLVKPDDVLWPHAQAVCGARRHD